jgi:hypothetical protein
MTIFMGMKVLKFFSGRFILWHFGGNWHSFKSLQVSLSLCLSIYLSLFLYLFLFPLSLSTIVCRRLTVFFFIPCYSNCLYLSISVICFPFFLYLTVFSKRVCRNFQSLFQI